MRHLITLVCDDVRSEVGNKLSLMGLYDEEMIVPAFPTRLPRITLFQRWVEAQRVQRFKVEFGGSAMSGVTRFEAPIERAPAEQSRDKIQLILYLAPLDLVAEGELKISTYIDNQATAKHVHTIKVRRGPIQ